MTRWRLALALLLVGAACQAGAIDAVSPLSAEQQARYQLLINQLRCLVCQNETIADSTAPLAQDLRDQVHEQIAQGRSDAQIKSYLTDRYGDFVLYKPPLKLRTFALWFGPFLILLVTLLSALMFVRRSRRVPAAAALDADALRRVLRDEDSL